LGSIINKFGNRLTSLQIKNKNLPNIGVKNNEKVKRNAARGCKFKNLKE
jgi:hypothetical protein